ncbi:hypothetical protein [Phenylobacterium sp.]|uniref:hypothetical protein n=2 Tax=Phenylobacterium sp. TaxID=1871053 RepID=UPI0027301125|nr:hypothetical protein [Phenylobacterium sp.]MDP1616319.1 hypothetical protein [Phenylobacterium sp.]
MGSLRVLAATAALAWGFWAATAAGQTPPPGDPEERLRTPAECVCAHPRGFLRNECKRRDLSCPVTAPGVVKLTDFVQLSEQTWAGAPVSPQIAYGRLKFVFAAAPELTGALSRRDSFFRRFRPQSRGILISVAAKAGAVELLPTTPMLAMELPAPGADGNTRTYNVKQEVYTAWVRVDGATALTPTIAFDSVSDTRIVFMEQILGRVASIYGTVTGDQILANVSNAVLTQKAQEIDQQIDWLVDPDGRDTRRFKDDSLGISPAAGGRRGLVFDIRDERNPGVKLATLTVTAELIPSMLLPAPRADAASLKLEQVATATKMRNVQGVATATGPRLFGAQPEYGQLRSDMQAASATATSITQRCQAFSTAAIETWRLVPVDADLLIFEALEDAAQLVSGPTATALTQNRCFNGDQRAQLKLMGRTVRGPIVPPNPLSILDMRHIGLALKGDGALPAGSSAKFADSLQIVSQDEAYGFLGDSMVSRAESVDVMALAEPKRFCCYNGLTPGRWTMGLDIAAEGGDARPMAIDFLTVDESRIGRIVLRAPTADERVQMLNAWTTPAPARASAAEAAAGDS